MTIESWIKTTVGTGIMAVAFAPLGWAQPANSPSDGQDGIPVTSSVVRRVCGTCHVGDADGRMSRISYQRGSPEGWQQTIRRMVLLNGLEVEPDDARVIVQYLANRHGLAPEEARPAAFEVERRLIDHVYEADPETQTTCTKCHSLGRVISQRRTREEWDLLAAMHQGYYPLVDFQSFYGRGVPSRGADGSRLYPIDKAIEHLSSAFPLTTPEWTAWSRNLRPTRLSGTWALTGSERGKGPVFGTVTLAAVQDAADEYQAQISYVYARTGQTVTRSGRSLVYTGFQWRGRSETEDGDVLREVMFVDRNQQQMSGRWFTGDHEERGLDITLTRVGSSPIVTGIYPAAIKQSSSEVLLTLYGVNLPDESIVGDFDFGPGVNVAEVVETSVTRAVVRAEVMAEAEVGTRDLFLGEVFLSNAVTVYDQVDRIEVTPATGMARIGGVVFPKRYEQFEARGYHPGADGIFGTADDLDLGMVDVEWTLEEYATFVGDDDTEFVGVLDSEGFFTPAIDGPNFERLNNNNNVGDVWVVATYRDQDSENETVSSLRARAHLLVTVPIYNRRDAWAGDQP